MVQETGDQADPAYRTSSLSGNRKLILACALLLSILFLAWLLFQNTRFPATQPFVLSLAETGSMACLLTIVIERLLNMMQVGIRARYRISFLLSAIIGSSFTLYRFSPFPDAFESLPDFLWLSFWIVWVFLGAFAGGLILTALTGGLVENNYAPSEEVAKQVFQHHAGLIGAPVDIPASKRLFDILLSLAGLCLSAPIWLLSILLIWLEDPGTLLFVKNSVGRGGINFQQYKFRTMIHGAEERTGPIMAAEGDERVLRTGKLLRKTALDELPQLINILKGEMSFVGPRPQRTVMVNEYLLLMPEYAYRHQVLPGLAGLAQVVGDYYLTPRQKLRFDRIYIRHANLGFDLLLILLAFLITFGYRWKKDWNGRLPRWLLHGRRSR